MGFTSHVHLLEDLLEVLGSEVASLEQRADLGDDEEHLGTARLRIGAWGWRWVGAGVLVGTWNWARLGFGARHTCRSSQMTVKLFPTMEMGMAMKSSPATMMGTVRNLPRGVTGEISP